MTGYALLLTGGFLAGCGLAGAGLGAVYVLARALHDY